MSWSIRLPVTLTLLAVALVYARGWVRLRKDLADVLPAWRFRCFLSGVILAWMAVASPLAMLDHELLTAHMVQHLVLMIVAAPLILLGAPVITLMHGLPQGLVRKAPALRPLNPLGRWITHPVFCWLASTAAVIGWHVPSLFALGMQGRWHDVQQASFLTAGLLFWWPIVQPWPSIAQWPRWSSPLYLFLATLPCDVLSAFLTFCNRVVYPHYLSAPDVFGLSPLGDQQTAGALMWVSVTFAYVIPAVAITVQMLAPQRRSARVRVL